VKIDRGCTSLQVVGGRCKGGEYEYATELVEFISTAFALFSCRGQSASKQDQSKDQSSCCAELIVGRSIIWAGAQVTDM
jgi:hypothetical protein